MVFILIRGNDQELLLHTLSTVSCPKSAVHVSSDDVVDSHSALSEVFAGIYLFFKCRLWMCNGGSLSSPVSFLMPIQCIHSDVTVVFLHYVCVDSSRIDSLFILVTVFLLGCYRVWYLDR